MEPHFEHYLSVETFGLVSFLREDGWRPSGTPGAGDEYAMPVSDEFCSILESGKMGLSSQRVECNTEINSQPSLYPSSPRGPVLRLLPLSVPLWLSFLPRVMYLNLTLG